MPVLVPGIHDFGPRQGTGRSPTPPVSSITPQAVRIGSGREAATRSHTTRVGMTGNSQTMSR